MPGPLRATGDPDALYNAGAAILVPDTLQERNRLSDELVELAQRLDDQRLSFWAAQRQGDVVTDAGDRSQTEPTLAAIRTLTASVPEPTFAWMRTRRRMPLTLLLGTRSGRADADAAHARLHDAMQKYRR